jgi:hypothetical protein
MSMIRGAIELATTQMVEGWIYSDLAPVRDQVVVAMSGDECLGAGRVDVYRSDLAGAGLGDGNCGFSFAISVARDAVDSIVVKLDGSDAVLLQAGAHVGTRVGKAAELKRSSVLWQISRLQWALKRGRISQSDFDFLRTLWPSGVYERGLIRRRAADDSVVIDPWRTVARGLFEAYLAFDAEISVREFRTISDFEEELARVLRSPELVLVVAIYCKGEAALRVLEGSHVTDGANGDGINSIGKPVEFTLSNEILIMLDTRLKVDLSLSDDSSIEVGVAKLPSSV